MNKLQLDYLAAKMLVDDMMANGTDAEFDAATNVLLDAEQALVDWALGIAEATGQMPQADLELLKENWYKPKWNGRMIDLAMRLKA